MSDCIHKMLCPFCHRQIDFYVFTSEMTRREVEGLRKVRNATIGEAQQLREENKKLREVLEYIASGDCADPAGWADLVLKEEAKR